MKALDASVGMGKEQTRVVQPGLTVRTISFEALLGELAEHHSLYMMDKKKVIQFVILRLARTRVLF